MYYFGFINVTTWAKVNISHGKGKAHAKNSTKRLLLLFGERSRELGVKEEEMIEEHVLQKFPF
jgi:hypothetical protein